MIEAYMKATEDVLRLAGQMFLRRMDDQLRWFAEDLHDFIYELDRNPRRDWRERFDAFLADQASRDRVITPESRKELIVYLEMWERNVYGGPPEPKPALQTVVTRIEEPTSVSRTAGRIPQIVPPRKSTVRKLRRSDMYRPPAEREFYQKLADARRLLTEMDRAVGLFAQKLDVAGDGESIEVDADLDAIETLIWMHNDVLESARALWLREDLEGDTFNQLAIMSDPTSVGLPRFIDDDQPSRAKAQWEKISARLHQRIAFLDNVIFAMEVIEKIGTAASFLMAGGILFQAAKQGGKVLLVKTVAMAASMAASAVVGKATGAALKGIGVEEETVEKVQNAAELISWLLILRRMGLPRNAAPRRNGKDSTDLKGDADGAGAPKKQPVEPSDPEPASRAITPYRDPQRPNYNTAATHIDHAQARALDGPDIPSNRRPLPAESNLRKGGYEGELKRYRNKLILAGMSKADAQAVIQGEINALRGSVVARPTDPKVLDSLPANPSDQGHPF